LGDYFKAEQLPWFFEFLTDKEKGDWARSRRRLYVTVFAGDEERPAIPRDTESGRNMEETFLNSKNIDALDVEF